MTETYQGSSCRQGHDGLRYKVNRGCVACATERAAARRLANPACAARTAEWAAANPKNVAYAKHKHSAATRGILWLFTFESWVTFWGDDFDRRGEGMADLCCGRRGDVGPYSPDNCEKITMLENLALGRQRRAA